MIPMRKNRKVRKVIDMAIYTLRNMVVFCDAAHNGDVLGFSRQACPLGYPAFRGGINDRDACPAL